MIFLPGFTPPLAAVGIFYERHILCRGGSEQTSVLLQRGATVLLSGLAFSSQAEDHRVDLAAAFQAFGVVEAKVGVLEAIDRFIAQATRCAYRRTLSLATSEDPSILIKPVIPNEPSYLVCGARLARLARYLWLVWD